MWHFGAEMTHEGINQLLRGHVDLDDQGRYIIEYRGQRCQVEVDDTFFVIRRAERSAADDGPVMITLNDGEVEELDASTLALGRDNVLYARVKNNRFPARFLRQAYYQLAEWVVEDEGRFLISVRGKAYPIK
ncbi:MAG: hypothetical protein V1816_17780 [Pseudomonadota bacterium]